VSPHIPRWDPECCEPPLDTRDLAKASPYTTCEMWKHECACIIMNVADYVREELVKVGFQPLLWPAKINPLFLFAHMIIIEWEIDFVLNTIEYNLLYNK